MVEKNDHSTARDLRPPPLAESGRGFDEVEEGYLHEDDPPVLPVRGQPALPPAYVKKNLPDLMAAEKAGALWTPLYPHASGPAQGFRCNVQANEHELQRRVKVHGMQPCGRVTRTERGMKSHLWSVHRIKQQGELFHDNTR